ncbi:hypothetical protein Tco_1204015 [Tanacetum coccineum]
MQDKNMVINELKKLILVTKGKSVETQFDKPSVVRQPNAQRIPKPSVLGKPTPFSNSPEMRSFQTKQSVNKTNVSDGLFKPVHINKFAQNRNQALPHASRNTNPHVSKSSGVNHTTSVSRPQLKCYQVKDKVVPNNSQVKFKKKEVEDHHRISSISKKTKSVTALYNSSYSLLTLDAQWPHSSMFKRCLIAADQALVFMEMTSVHISSGLVLHQMTSDHNRSELGIKDHSNEQSSLKLVLKVVVRLGINPMIQPEPEDLPKDNPKLEITVLRSNGVLDGNLHFAWLDDSVYKSKVSETITSVPNIETTASKTSKDSFEEPKPIRPSALLIEEWESDIDDDCEIRPSIE